MNRDYQSDLDRRFEQRLADTAEVAWQEYQAREQKRRQMREPIAPKPERLGWDVAVLVLAVLLIILGCWNNDIGVKP